MPAGGIEPKHLGLTPPLGARRLASDRVDRFERHCNGCLHTRTRRAQQGNTSIYPQYPKPPEPPKCLALLHGLRTERVQQLYGLALRVVPHMAVMLQHLPA